MKKIRDFIEGTLRYELYYRFDGKLRFLIRQHIREQFEYRLTVMDKECLSKGECKLCGCNTTALQFASRACDKPCYQSMVTKKVWNAVKKEETVEEVFSNFRTVNSKIVDLGEVPEKEKIEIHFVDQLASEEVKRMSPGCSCTGVDRVGLTLIAHYDNGKIPYHIKSETQSFTKMVTVEYYDGVKERYYIKGVKVRK